MADHALKILENDTVLDQFKRNALETAKKFDIKNILPLYEEIYQKVINNSTSKAVN